MILEAARAAISRLFSPEFRWVFLKSLGLTLLTLAAMWFGLREIFAAFAWPWIDQWLPALPEWADWLGVLGSIAAGFGLAIGLALFVAPVTALVAGLFLDDVAEVIEREDYPADPPGKAVPTIPALWLSIKFLGVVVLGNLLALVLLLVPGINIAAFFIVNGYLLGREFFEFAAMRHRPEAQAKALRRANRGTIFMAGLVIAGFLAVPLLNLLTPLFAAAMMTHLHKLMGRRSPPGA